MCRKNPLSKNIQRDQVFLRLRLNRVSVATPALPCDGHVETKSDAGCAWSHYIKTSVSLAGSFSETGV